MTRTLGYIYIIGLLLCGFATTQAQDTPPSAGIYMRQDSIAGESAFDILLPSISVSGRPHRPLTPNERQLYWRRVRDVKIALPIAQEIAAIMIETYDYAETLPTERAKRAHLKRVEKDLIRDYKPRMKKLTLGQGRLLIKLIDRETGSSGYELVEAIYGTLTASWYNLMAKFYGGNLKERYDPTHREDDAVTERIIYLYRAGLI